MGQSLRERRHAVDGGLLDRHLRGLDARGGRLRPARRGAMRGMRTWTSARSIERCSRSSSSIVSATPTSTSVAGAASSESSLIVSVKSARSAGVREAVELVEEDRERARSDERLEPARDGVRRDRPRRRTRQTPGSRRPWSWRRTRSPRLSLCSAISPERLAPHRREVVARVARRRARSGRRWTRAAPRRRRKATSCRRRARRRRRRAGPAAPRPRRAPRSGRCGPRTGCGGRPAPTGGTPARRAASARAAPLRRACG